MNTKVVDTKRRFLRDEYPAGEPLRTRFLKKRIAPLMIALSGIAALSMSRYQDAYLIQEQIDTEKMAVADSLIVEEYDLDAALVILDAVLPNVPDNYSEIFKKQRRFWSYNEYLEYVETTKENVEWIQDVYCRIFFYYAVIHIEKRNPDKAGEYLLRGLKLIPDEPHLLCEMGMLYQSMDNADSREAIKYYTRSLESDFCPAFQKARGLRGIGYCLIELDELDKAEESFTASLMYEDNEIAHDEIAYIHHLRSCGAKAKEESVIYR
ncbi:MAG: hypothetical protein LBC19_00705 [Tannerella sp.]|jgi:tetratricopeptide (TPR) repeat protein|nr:hypothetical protein [Tannerella sp.]